MIYRMLVATLIVWLTATTATAATIQDETGGPMVTPVRTGMSNQPVDLQTVQEAFTESDPMANTLNVRYKKGRITKIYVREFMDTHIILNEAVDGYSLGDEANFHWVPGDKEHSNRGRIFFDNPGADTNLTLFGASGAVYSFYLRAIPHDSQHLPHLTVFVNNPEVDGAKLVSESRTESRKAAGRQLKETEADGEYLRSLSDVDVTNLNYSYEIRGGNDELAPVLVMDDGVWTYFKFDDENFDRVPRLPVVYKVVDGFDTPVNTRKFKGTIIAESLSDGWTLRHGGSHLCIRKND